MNVYNIDHFFVLKFQLRPADDVLPDLTAEALHSLSHAYHALSDVTTNFHAPEPRLNILPMMSPAPPTVTHVRNTSTANSQAQTSSSSTSQATTSAPIGIPIGIGLRPGGGLGSGIGVRTVRGLGPGFSLRPGFTLRSGNGVGPTFASRNGIPAGIGLFPGGAGLGASFAGSPVTSVPSSSSAASSTAAGIFPRPQNPQVSVLLLSYCHDMIVQR